MLEVNSRPIMRGRVFLMLFALLLCAWSGTPDALQDEVSESSVPTNQQQAWNQAHRPIWQSGHDSRDKKEESMQNEQDPMHFLKDFLRKSLNDD